MNTVWSDYVQGINTLYLSRKNRFDEVFFNSFLKLFGLDADREFTILEIGCGPGALCEALRRAYPKAHICGIDRDSAFIDYAQKHISGADFIEGDATQLPFGDESFDVTISNTVSEHVEPAAFFGEQRRVLKKGGVCLVLSARKGIRVQAPCLTNDEAEEAFWRKAAELDDSFEKYAVCRYPMNESELPRAMEKYGFCDVRTGYAVSDLTPDDPKYSRPFALQMLETLRQDELDALFGAQRTLGEHFTKDEYAAIEKRINEKHDLRKKLFDQGQKQWDTAISLTMVVRGIKP